ncbi:hypothetical protein U1Q18_014055 [Sarracenia purpurea var. burkii]
MEGFPSQPPSNTTVYQCRVPISGGVIASGVITNRVPCKVTGRWRSRQPKVTEEDYSQTEIGDDFGKGRRRQRRRVKTLAPSSTGATISGATSALFSDDFASSGLACVIRVSCVDSEESSKVFWAKRNHRRGNPQDPRDFDGDVVGGSGSSGGDEWRRRLRSSICVFGGGEGDGAAVEGYVQVVSAVVETGDSVGGKEEAVVLENFTKNNTLAEIHAR